MNKITPTSVICVPVLLTANPNIRDEALAGVIEANIKDFKGYISVTTKTHKFASGNKQAREIYITPYGSFKNFLVTIKRTFVGVQFPALTNNGTHITEYALGLLQEGSDQYREAEKETREAFSQKRRFIISIANDCSSLEITLDQDSGTCVIL